MVQLHKVLFHYVLININKKKWRNLSNQNVKPELTKKKSYYMNLKLII